MTIIWFYQLWLSGSTWALKLGIGWRFYPAYCLIWYNNAQCTRSQKIAASLKFWLENLHSDIVATGVTATQGECYIGFSTDLVGCIVSRQPPESGVLTHKPKCTQWLILHWKRYNNHFDFGKYLVVVSVAG